MLNLRIATFNLENLDETASTQALVAARVGVLRPQLLRLDADILCLQEVSAHGKGHHHRALEALDHLIADTPYAGYARFSSTGPHGDAPADVHNLVMLSRWPLRQTRQIRHDLIPPLDYTPVTATGAPNPHLDSRFDRPLLYAAAELPDGRILHVIDLHLRSPLAAVIPGQKRSSLVWRSIGGWAEGYFLAALKRNAQALEARLFVEQLFDADENSLIAVCGDFNAEAREVPVRTLQGTADDTGNPALAPRVLHVADAALPAAERFSIRHSGMKIMLDHILVSPRLNEHQRGAEVLNQTLADEVLDADPNAPPLGSFHAPLVATFAL